MTGGRARGSGSLKYATVSLVGTTGSSISVPARRPLAQAPAATTQAFAVI